MARFGTCWLDRGILRQFIRKPVLRAFFVAVRFLVERATICLRTFSSTSGRKTMSASIKESTTQESESSNVDSASKKIYGIERNEINIASYLFQGENRHPRKISFVTSSSPSTRKSQFGAPPDAFRPSYRGFSGWLQAPTWDSIARAC